MKSASRLRRALLSMELPQWWVELAVAVSDARTGHEPVLRGMELFAGQGELTSAMNKHAGAFWAYDKLHDDTHDLLTDEGLSIAVQWLLCIRRPGGLLWMGIPCSTWITLSRAETPFAQCSMKPTRKAVGKFGPLWLFGKYGEGNVTTNNAPLVEDLLSNIDLWMVLLKAFPHAKIVAKPLPSLEATVAQRSMKRYRPSRRHTRSVSDGKLPQIDYPHPPADQTQSLTIAKEA